MKASIFFDEVAINEILETYLAQKSIKPIKFEAITEYDGHTEKDFFTGIKVEFDVD